MNYISLLALIEILSAISMGVVLLAITYKLVIWFGRRYHHVDEINTSYSLFTASVLFAIGLTMSGVIQPLLSSYRLLDRTTQSTSRLFFTYIFNGGIYISISYLSSILICLTGITLYSKLTPIDEFVELRRDNIGVAIIMGTIIILLNLLTKDGVSMLIESIIPYPDLPPK